MRQYRSAEQRVPSCGMRLNLQPFALRNADMFRGLLPSARSTRKCLGSRSRPPVNNSFESSPMASKSSSHLPWLQRSRSYKASSAPKIGANRRNEQITSVLLVHPVFPAPSRGYFASTVELSSEKTKKSKTAAAAAFSSRRPCLPTTPQKC